MAELEVEPKESGFSVHTLNKFHSVSRQVLETGMQPLHTAGLGWAKGRRVGPPRFWLSSELGRRFSPSLATRGRENLNRPGPSRPPSRPWLPSNQSSNIYPKRNSKGMSKLPHLVSMQHCNKKINMSDLCILKYPKQAKKHPNTWIICLIPRPLYTKSLLKSLPLPSMN